MNLRSNNAHTPLPLWIAQALHASSTLIERGQPGTQISRIPAVCRQQPQNSLLHKRFISIFNIAFV